MPGWFDHERDRIGEPHAPIRTPDYDDLTFQETNRLYGLRQARRARLVLAASAFLVGILLIVLPMGLLFVIVGAVLFVGGLVTTPIAAYLLRSVNREIAGRELEQQWLSREAHGTSATRPG